MFVTIQDGTFAIGRTIDKPDMVLTMQETENLLFMLPKCIDESNQRKAQARLSEIADVAGLSLCSHGHRMPWDIILLLLKKLQAIDVIKVTDPILKAKV